MSPELFVAVRDFLAVYFRTQEDRETVLLPQLSNWPGRRRIKYEGAGEAFSTHLVEQLPADLLKSVVRAVAEMQGEDRIPVAESLNARIEATENQRRRRHGVVLRRREPVPSLSVDSPPVLFHQAEPYSRRQGPKGGAASAVDLCTLDDGSALLLAMDFAADVPGVLHSIAHETDAHWISGADLFERHRQGGQFSGLGAVDLQASVVLVDFSAVRPEFVLGPRSGAPTFAEAIDDLLVWARDMGHPVVIGVPRFVLAPTDLEPLRQRLVRMLSAADLFSESYAYRAEECERLLGRALPFPSLFWPLLSANSAALPAKAAQILATLPATRPFKDIDGWDQVAAAVGLARAFTDAGFHEIAYRLEGLCRTVGMVQQSISLSADLRIVPTARREDLVVGFVESTDEIPAAISRASLIGGTGSGKSTVLRRIEHTWFRPCSDEAEAVEHYLPVRLALDGGDQRDLNERAGEYFRQESFAWLVEGGRQLDLACHALVGRIGSLDGFRRLFSSPVYLLLDDVEQLTSPARDRLARDIRRLSTEDPRLGALLACRHDRTAKLLMMSELSLHELNERQLRSLLLEGRRPSDLFDLLIDNVTAIARHLRNPQLLAVLRELGLRRADLAGANLSTILGRYAGRADGTIAEHQRKPAMEWLDQVALGLKQDGLRRRLVGHAAEQEFVATGRLLGILAGSGGVDVAEFRFELLRDYFAARRLARELDGSSIAAVLRRLVSDVDEWRDVMRVLAGLLPLRDAFRLIEYLAARGAVRVAHECALELPDTAKAGEATATALLRELSAAREDDVDTRLTAARALDRLDPRIAVRNPRRNLVPVPSAEQTDDLRIGRYPVTNAEFAEFVRDGGYDSERWWTPAGWTWVTEQRIRFPRYWLNRRLSLPNQPVTGVNYYEASAYCAWLTAQQDDLHYRLPSALEWDRAAHGGDRVFLEVMEIVRGNEPLVRQNGKPIRRRLGRRGTVDQDPGPPLHEPDFVFSPDRVADVEELVAKIKERMARHEHGPERSGVAPVGIHQANELGVHDLFGSVWQWCGTSMAVLSATERELYSLSGVEPERGAPVVVKGGPMTTTSDPVWTLLGGWFDPLVRFHKLGFRVSCHAAGR